ncbi:MAG: 50S ribosomal protein L2 [Planctomycetes bacterium]|nr:50S ribosomal protein L2 [Planctomycetota bacterium]
MTLKTYNAYTPSRRSITALSTADITKTTPEKGLTVALRKSGGRNNTGRLSVRHIGGGHRRRYRIIDFTRNKLDIPARVSAIEYDPNRNCRIALLFYKDGEKRYILCPDGLKVGDTVIAANKAEPAVGNSMFLKNIPIGTQIHNLELTPGSGGKLARGAGTFAQILGREGLYSTVLMPSGEIRKLNMNCRATVGRMGNIEANLVTFGKAGRTRWLGIRPTVRGVAMNPVAHPNGGGVGRKIGKPPVSKWGKPAKGGITRDRKRMSSRFIIRMRPSGPKQPRT